MNALIAVVLGAITVYLTYTRYARRIDRDVIQSDPKRATPATLYMDGVDFMPTNRNILFGYHFKSIAARSEERRVGKECRCRWGPDHEKKKMSVSRTAYSGGDDCTTG